MNKQNDGGPAFPYQVGTQSGMTMRDYFATHASEDDIRNAMPFGASWDDSGHRALARFAHADAMLAAREAK